MKKIDVFIKRVGEKPYHTSISNSLENLQRTVGGYIEFVRIGSDWGILCDEEGLLKDTHFNCTVCGHQFFGTIVFVGVNGEEFTNIPTDFKNFKNVFSELFKEEK